MEATFLSSKVLRWLALRQHGISCQTMKVLLPLPRRMQERDGTLASFEILMGTQNMGASASHADLIAWDTHSCTWTIAQ